MFSHFTHPVIIEAIKRQLDAGLPILPYPYPYRCPLSIGQCAEHAEYSLNDPESSLPPVAGMILDTTWKVMRINRQDAKIAKKKIGRRPRERMESQHF